MNDAWLAGWLEGEGAFYITPAGHAAISANSTDRDVIASVVEYTGMGRVRGPYKKSSSNHKDQYMWGIAYRTDVETILHRIYPYMHERRRKKIDKLLAVIEKDKAKYPYPRGVAPNGKRFRAYFKRKHLGTFDTVEEAMVAHRKARYGF